MNPRVGGTGDLSRPALNADKDVRAPGARDPRHIPAQISPFS